MLTGAAILETIKKITPKQHRDQLRWILAKGRQKGSIIFAFAMYVFFVLSSLPKSTNIVYTFHNKRFLKNMIT